MLHVVCCDRAGVYVASLRVLRQYGCMGVAGLRICLYHGHVCVADVWMCQVLGCVCVALYVYECCGLTGVVAVCVLLVISITITWIFGYCGPVGVSTL